MLALETHANIRSLRAVDAQCPFSPSVLRWTSTVALLLCVSPRLALEMVKLFHACAMLDIEPYRRAFDAMMFVVGVALGLAVALTLGGET